MKRTRWATIFLIGTLAAGGQSLQQSTRREIDRCAQDGRYFYAWGHDLSKPVEAEMDGVSVRIERPNEKATNDAILTYSRKGHKLIQQVKDFEAGHGWLTVSANGSFAVTWTINYYVTYTQLFTIADNNDIVEKTSLIASAQKAFDQDAKRVCKDPGFNTVAVKWRDKDRLLIAIDAWSTGSCSSNFTEGFILDVAANRIARKLTEQELLNLPAVCTWNIVPLNEH